MNRVIGEWRKIFLATLNVLFAWVAVASADLQVGDRVPLESIPLVGVDAKCRDDFLEKAPHGWRTLTQALRGFEVEVRYIEEWEDKSKLLRRRQNEWIVCKPTVNSLLLVSESSKHKVAVANERYSFQVRCNAEDGKFALMNVEAWSRGRKRPLLGPLGDIDEFLNRTTSIWWVPCEHILTNLGDGGFEIISASYVSGSAEHSVAQIAFRYNGELRNSPFCFPGAIYWGEFLPEKYWAVVRSGVVGLVDGAEQLRILVKTSYQDWFGGSCFPSSSIVAYEDIAKTRIVEVKTTTFGRPSPEMRPKEPFYLPYYGISEAVALSQGISTKHWRLTLNICAVAALVLAIILRKYVRKRMTAVRIAQGSA